MLGEDVVGTHVAIVRNGTMGREEGDGGDTCALEERHVGK